MISEVFLFLYFSGCIHLSTFSNRVKKPTILFRFSILHLQVFLWRNAKVAVQIKLQWFQFPQGLRFQNNFFGTNEISMFFKAKEAISDEKSAKVDFDIIFVNQIMKELELLAWILQQ